MMKSLLCALALAGMMSGQESYHWAGCHNESLQKHISMMRNVQTFSEGGE